MAAKKTNNYNAIMADLKKGVYVPVYLLTGDEPYFIDQIADFIADNVLDELERDFNQQVVYGADYTAAQIADMAKALPMMAQRRVVIVRQAQNIKKWEALTDYLKQPAPATILVLCCMKEASRGDERKKGWTQLVKAAGNVGVVLESNKIYESHLPAFIENYLSERNVAIDHNATMLIADHIGRDLTRITSELDKVAATLPGQDKRITQDIVTANIGVSREYNIYELKNAIIAHDVLKSNRIWKYFEDNNAAANFMQTIPALFSYFQTLFIAHFAPQKNDIAGYLGLSQQWQAREYTDGMRHYNATKTLQIIGKIHEIAAKGNGVDNKSGSYGDLMRELLFFIFH